MRSAQNAHAQASPTQQRAMRGRRMRQSASRFGRATSDAPTRAMRHERQDAEQPIDGHRRHRFAAARGARATAPYARAASPPTPAGRKLPTNELTRKMRAASRAGDRRCRWRAAAGSSADHHRAIERDQRQHEQRDAHGSTRSDGARRPRAMSMPRRETREDRRGDARAGPERAGQRADHGCVMRLAGDERQRLEQVLADLEQQVFGARCSATARRRRGC